MKIMVHPFAEDGPLLTGRSVKRMRPAAGLAGFHGHVLAVLGLCAEHARSSGELRQGPAAGAGQRPEGGARSGTSYAVAPFIALNAVQFASASLYPSSEQVARA